MDSVRVYEKYLTAKVRAQRMQLTLSNHHLPTTRLNHRRLPAGGSSSDKINDCQETSLSCPAIKTSKHQLRFRCKLPVVVVPSKQHVLSKRSGASGSLKSLPKSLLKSGTKKSLEHVGSEVEPINSLTQPEIGTNNFQKSGSPNHKMEPVKHISFQENLETVVPPEEAHSKIDNTLPEISLQLATLIKTLENQVDCEIKQKEELNAINDQLKLLSGTMNNLNEKCKFVEMGKEAFQINSLEGQENDKPSPESSSICEFCKNQDLMVLSSIQSELFRLMGKRLFTDVSLTILLRADNVYHINIRDLESGKSVGCLLANDEAIKEANRLGIFQEILTFFVIDNRSTIKKRDNIEGGISFEVVKIERLSGGDTIPSQTSCTHTEQFKNLNNTNMNMKTYPNCSKPPFLCKNNLNLKLTVSQAMLQIGTISSSLILSDEETKYPVRSIEIVSLSDSSLNNTAEDSGLFS